MFKKIPLTMLAILFFSSPVMATENYVLAEPPAYQVSDTDVKILIRQMNNIEQCIYPELASQDAKNVYMKWLPEDLLAMRFYQDRLLEHLIGEQNFIVWKQDQTSQDFFYQKVDRFNHQVANVDAELCEAFKIDYRQKREQAQALLQQHPKRLP